MIEFVNGKLIIDDEEYNLNDFKKLLKNTVRTSPYKEKAA